MFPGKIIEISLEVVGQKRFDTKSPVRSQQEVLKHLLKKAKNTQFGKYYDFKTILKSDQIVANFQYLVPLFEYETMAQLWWYRVMRGESNVTWPGKIRYFALSSGTSGTTSKRIPVSRDMLDTLRQGALRILSLFPKFKINPDVYLRSWLAIGGSSHLEKCNRHYEGYISGINARKKPFWAKAIYKPGKKIAEITDFDLRTECIADQAEKWNVGLIIGIPHWVQLTLERVLAKNQLQQIKDIWPHFHTFISGGVDNHPYRKRLEKLVGHPLRYINVYLASEGLIGIQSDPDSEELQLFFDQGLFFEFIPYEETYFDQDGNVRLDTPVLTMKEVVKDIDYALVVSSCAGLWRYVLGDIIRFSDPAKGKFVISGRTKYYLNLCTEHVTGDNMNAALSKTEEDLGIEIIEFMIAPIKTDKRIVHHWYVGLDQSADLQLLRKTLDDNLKLVNDDYRTERNTALEMEMDFVPLTWFYEWHKDYNPATGQSKIPRVLTNNHIISWNNYLKSKKETFVT